MRLCGTLQPADQSMGYLLSGRSHINQTSMQSLSGPEFGEEKASKLVHVYKK